VLRWPPVSRTSQGSGAVGAPRWACGNKHSFEMPADDIGSGTADGIA
jgi:hypothetical protein